MPHRYTMEELEAWTDHEFLKMVVRDRMESCTNIYSPLYKALTKMHRKLDRGEKLTK